MMVTIEKMEVSGTLLTNMGHFTLLGDAVEKTQDGMIVMPVVDLEGFYNMIIVKGDFIIVPDVLSTMVEVKRVLTDEEVQTTNIPAEILPETIE